MSYQVRFTKAAKSDIVRLYGFLLEHDPAAARKALAQIEKGIKFLQDFPFTCRKVTPENSFLREMILSFGAKGYVVLFEIENNNTVTILALRHQHEEDYH
ncbi:MAG: type II toxin-antitoxin system RelE/ParE family toxin [Desulfuromonas sp.]|nr:type II toxin-antitoxin system RelE/ParE family toxin [Desulfuromonas sp.]